jgi:Lrp/AsnC family transcriptional regulator for asnA, asnC and gidA|tara:strand:+ start:54 stop:512 length:459 start_codon:yes stop_codon:yes gene_type:complete
MTSKQLDKIDKAILRELIEDGTRSRVSFARQLKVSEATIRKRIERLEKEEVMKIIALTNPLKMGLTVVSFIFQIKPDMVSEAAFELAQYPNIQYLAITTGQFDLLAWAVFRNQNDVYNFVANEAAKLPGIIRSETQLHLNLVKRAHNWILRD